MATSRKMLPVLLYFYQGEITQEDADKVVEHFSDKMVQFRKVVDINDTRDTTESCAYAAGTVPNIYLVRKSSDVLTDGILPDPLNQPNAAKTTTDSEDETINVNNSVRLVTGAVQPTDANIAAKLLKEEVAQATAKKEDPEIKVEDVKIDEQAPDVNSVSGAVGESAVKADPETAKAKGGKADKAAVDQANADATVQATGSTSGVAPAATTPVAPAAPVAPVVPKA